MRILQAYNLHRGGGGADNATLATIAALREEGVDIECFARDSRDIGPGLAGRLRAFVDGLYATEAVAAFNRRLDAFRPDLVHVHELYPLISPWILPACTRRGIPVVMSVYDYRLSCPVHNHHHQGRLCTRCLESSEFACVRQNCRGSRAESVAFALRNWVARQFGLFSRHISLFTTPTAFTADWLVRHAGIPARRTAVIPCLIDMPETTVDPAEGQYMAFAGRFVAEKGVEVALAAARRAGLPLWLAGDADHYPGVSAEDDVRFVMTRNREELAAFYRGARLFVMPSLWFETFGIVVGESMSHGVPVLASRIGALAETTVDGVTGFLFEPGDVADLADKMRRVWDDPELCRRLGSGAREHILRTAHRDVHTRLTLDAYASAIALGPSSDDTHN